MVRYKQMNKKIIYISLIVIGALLIGFSAFRIISSNLEYTAARNEYRDLSDIFRANLLFRPPPVPVLRAESEDYEYQHEPEFESEPEAESDDEEFVDPVEVLREINPDFIGWIWMDGILDYPIVQGADNIRYLNTTFKGERNQSGAIFMDYRNNADFDGQVTIIYGHNMRDGSMFAPLHQFRGAALLDVNRDFIIVTSDLRALTYRIVAARIVNVWDVENDPTQKTVASVRGAVHEIPEDAEYIVILSTCTPTADRNERLRIYAVRTSYFQVSAARS